MNTPTPHRARSWVVRGLALLGVVGAMTMASCRAPDAVARGTSRATRVSPTFSEIYEHEAIACDHPLASEAGAAMLAKGGNAVDAAVAASFALSVVRPYSCGIGGGGFMVVVLAPSDEHPEGLRVALDYRETAPAGVGAAYFETLADDASQTGGTSVGVPGTVAGLLYALAQWGTLDRAVVMAPAIRLAEKGYAADAHHAATARGVLASIGESERGDATRFGLLRQRMLGPVTHTGGEPGLRDGDLVRLPEQGAVLRAIAEHGQDAFYTGPIAERIVDAVRRDGGAMTLADLRAYEPVEREPLEFAALGRVFVAMPPPSSGGLAMAEALGIYERVGELHGGMDASEALRAHRFIESLKHAFADRAAFGGDPGFAEVPVARLMSDGYLDARAAAVDPARTFPPEQYAAERFAGVDAVGAAMPPDDAGTSHLSVVDRFGNAVACTETINTLYGSLLVPEGLGFALNDEMDDFTARAGVANAYGLMQSSTNAPAPGKRPLSSMSPTVVVDADGRVEAVGGASGGPRIITATLGSLLYALTVESDTPAHDALVRARIHHQWLPNQIDYEPGGLSAEARAGLEAMGHALNERGELGVAQLVVRTRGGRWNAASDPRKGGRPAGR